jgi:rhodanese-related sulfurtransferase
MADALPLDITCGAVKANLDAAAEMVLIDCREPDEHALVHIEGATLIPMSEMSQRAGELDGFRDRHVVVHCHHGGRSMRVVQWLRQQGFAKAQNMAGGIDQWAVEIDPGMARY